MFYTKRFSMDYKDILPFQINGQMIKVSNLYRFLTNNAYLCRMNMRNIIYLFAILLTQTACDGTKVSEKLDQIDSLIAKDDIDSACLLLKDVAGVSMTEEAQAHYRLLTTQLGYLSNEPLPSDSLLDLALIYCNKVGNNQKLADTYHYKSYRSRINQDYPQAILYCKEAERFAMGTNDIRLQYKIYENLAYLNNLCDNDLLQVHYAKKALDLAQKVQNGNWIAFAYNIISIAFANLGQYDSAYYYVQKTAPYIKYVSDREKVAFLINIGVLYKGRDNEKAKEYFEKSLTLSELPEAYEHLADVYFSEGRKEEAYKLWKKALTIDGRYEKDNLIHSIISYDLERGKLDEASANLDRAISIKDSIINVLRNDTIKDLQLRFDHEVAMHEADKKLISVQRLLMGSAIILMLMAFYIYFRKKREEARQREYQDQLYAYTTEIEQLTFNRDHALAHIKELESNKDENLQKISQLEAEAKEAETTINKLNLSIKKLLNEEAPKLKEGKLLYDQIIEGKTTLYWSHKEEEYFNKYYAATHYQSYNRLRKVKRATKLSAHNLFYLILKDMGKSDDEVRRIMTLSPEGLRSIRNRTKPLPQE